LGINISYTPFTENADGTVDCEEKKNQKPGCLWKAVNADFHHQKSQKFKDLLIDSYQDFFEPLPVGGQTKVCAVTGIESPDCVKLEDMYILPSVKEQIQLGEELRDLQHFKTFEDYAGDTKLGILRMDVDGLGKRFVVGFKSIQEYKAFSKRLVEFFEKETVKIQQEKEFREYLNIIYAGGDDLFVVGRWDKVTDFAERIHKEVDTRFSKDGITISGGMVVVNPKYPIAKAAELAGKAEDAAKQFRNGEKNAFSLLGKTISWKDEFDFVKGYCYQFSTLIEKYGLSKSLLHKIMLYASIADQNKVRRREGKPEDFSYIWHISYYLTRFINRYKSNEEVCVFCRQLRDKDIDYKKGRNLELIALAARWAELLLRDNNN
jgi:CRISPR-associated protein Csm1